MSNTKPRTAWFAVTTRSRHEKLVSEHLRNKGLEEFLPMYRARKRWSDRVKMVELPLFPGYVFCRFNPVNRLPVVSTAGVSSIVGFAGEPAPIDDGEISDVRRMVDSGLPTFPWPYLRCGSRVRIRTGAMDGLEGLLVRERASDRVVVNIQLLRRAVAVEIDRDAIEPLG